jgi:protein disulfide-isomerase A1
MGSIGVSARFRALLKYIISANSQSLVSYVKRQTLPIVTTITTDSLREIKSIGSAVVVGAFLPGDDDSLEAFTSVAKTLHEDYIFGVLHDNLLAETEQISIPGITLYKAFDQERITLEPTSDSKAIYDLLSLQVHLQWSSFTQNFISTTLM